MALAVPMRLLKKEEDKGIVEFGDTKHNIDLVLVPNAKIGDYIISHDGCAIGLLNESEAKKAVEIFHEMAGGTGEVERKSL